MQTAADLANVLHLRFQLTARKHKKKNMSYFWHKWQSRRKGYENGGYKTKQVKSEKKLINFPIMSEVVNYKFCTIRKEAERKGWQTRGFNIAEAHITFI